MRNYVPALIAAAAVATSCTIVNTPTPMPGVEPTPATPVTPATPATPATPVATAKPPATATPPVTPPVAPPATATPPAPLTPLTPATTAAAPPPTAPTAPLPALPASSLAPQKGFLEVRADGTCWWAEHAPQPCPPRSQCKPQPDPKKVECPLPWHGGGVDGKGPIQPPPDLGTNGYLELDARTKTCVYAPSRPQPCTAAKPCPSAQQVACPK
jgi:hypothetical protein